jgi:hypothetical protein
VFPAQLWCGEVVEYPGLVGLAVVDPPLPERWLFSPEGACAAGALLIEQGAGMLAQAAGEQLAAHRAMAERQQSGRGLDS